MKILSALQLKELDEFTIQEEEITSLDLMERAAGKVSQFIRETYPQKGRQIVIFSGPGNNGGDGLVVARQLSAYGYTNIEVYLFNTSNSLSGDCKKNAERLQSDCESVRFVEVTQQFEAPQLTTSTLIVDAIFGTGLNKPLSGGYAALTQFINSTQSEVVSIDMPSGLMCEDNTYNSPTSIVQATHTLTFQLPKLSHLLADNQKYVGQLHVLDIGLSSKKINETPTHFEIAEPRRVAQLLKHRPLFGHKGTFGHGLLIAGQYGMAGAAILAAKACLRSGAGKVTVHTPLLNNDILQVSVPEAILSHDADSHIFSSQVATENYQAIAIGPGIGTHKRTALAFIEQVSHARVPLVLDADAINILGDHKGWISQVPPQTVLTPHPGEMQHLGICNRDAYSTLIEAINMAQRHHFYIVLKGHFTAICQPDGRVLFNPNGNSGMGTAGCGDVLTGVITGLLAQGYSQEDACILGVFLHGLAGDIAAEEKGVYSLTASDVIEALPKAFLQVGKLATTEMPH